MALLCDFSLVDNFIIQFGSHLHENIFQLLFVSDLKPLGFQK